MPDVNNTFVISKTGEEFWKQPNPWARISEIAARVGVSPRKDGDPPSVIARGEDGNDYDIMAVVVAVLDRIEKAAAK